MKATIHYRIKNSDKVPHHLDLPDDMPHAEAWKKVREYMAEKGIPPGRYQVTGILTDKQREVLAFIEKHGRATVTHLAHHFGNSSPVAGGVGYYPLTAILKKLKLIREREYLGHRTFIPFHPNPRLPKED